MFLNRSLRHMSLRSSYVITHIRTYSALAVPIKSQDSWQPFVPGRKFDCFAEYNALDIAMQKKRRLEHQSSRKKRKLLDLPAHSLIEGSNEEVLELEVSHLLNKAQAEQLGGDDAKSSDINNDDSGPTRKSQPIEQWAEYEVDVIQLSSTGDGLAYGPNRDHIIVVPFTVPGDKAIAKVYKVLPDYSHADFVKLLKPSVMREGTTPPCKYFSECGGCQLQMISYADQLKHKKTIVEKAFKYFSNLPSHKIPAVEETMGSPLQYGYRTKLSPHFSIPRRFAKNRDEEDLTNRELPNIGFNRKGTSRVMDIEQCPIGTDILNEGMKIERAKTIKTISTFKNGATLLLRESTRRDVIHESSDDHSEATSNPHDLSSCNFDEPPISSELITEADGAPQIRVTYPTYVDRKTYISDMTGMSTEYIGSYKFINRAGSFFQNNNSILRPFTAYVRDQVNRKKETESTTSQSEPEIKYLLDAYCGSGLFTITLSPLFSSALGIDCDRRGIEAARLNAESNNIPNAGFIDADASDLFADVPYPPDQSLVVIDPPRRGASEDFLRQLCMFRAKRVIYVSCNVHSQARDVGMIVNGFDDLKFGCRYEIESLKGFDFFPQTGHVEGVCVLNRVD